jgi:hypothetical protein
VSLLGTKDIRILTQQNSPSEIYGGRVFLLVWAGKLQALENSFV